MGARESGAFPRRSLRDLDGGLRPLAEAWSGGEALFLVGHGDCRTTMLALPFVDRLHRRSEGAAVRLILQDDAETARVLAGRLRLAAPILLEEDPYRLSRELGLTTVPTLFLVGRDGEIGQVLEGWNRAEVEALALRMGVRALLTTEDEAPAFRPG
jgi:hypothetical protein